jgi:cell division protease FtsH
MAEISDASIDFEKIGEDTKKYTTKIDPTLDKELIAVLRENDVKFSYEPKSNVLLTIIINMLPFALFLLIFLFIMRQMQIGGSKAMSFGKSRAKLLSEGRPKVTFDDVAGADEAKEELQEILEFLKDPQKFQKLGGRIPKGVLLVGPPGSGKTLLARAIAGEANVPFLSISGSDFVEMFVGVGASRVRDLFEQGKKNAPCIIFMDEIDAVGRQRGAGWGGGHDEREQTLNALLVEMDGFSTNEGVILIAATNRPDVLDKALLRPGRFDRQIVVDLPDVKGRQGILKVHTKKIPLADDVNLEIMAKGTPYFSGADLANLVNESALLAARKNKRKVDMSDLEEARDKVMMGPERRSRMISENEKKVTAFHESGHAIVAKMLPGADPVHKVTIIPRGMSLGATHSLPGEEKYLKRKNDAVNDLCIFMGGRAAEEIVFGDITSGASNDIARATELAHKMVCSWGMSEKLGPLAFGNDEPVFLGRDFGRMRDFSEKTAVTIDEEVRSLIEESHKKALDILNEKRDVLDSMAQALLDYETLSSEEVDQLIAGEKIERAVNKKAEDEKEQKDEDTRDKEKSEEKKADFIPSFNRESKLFPES